MSTSSRLNIRGASPPVTVALTTDVATTPEISKCGYREGIVHVPTGSTITTLTFHAAHTLGGTYLPLFTAAGAAVTLTVAATRAYLLPTSVDQARYIRVVANAAGSVVFEFQS